MESHNHTNSNGNASGRDQQSQPTMSGVAEARRDEPSGAASPVASLADAGRGQVVDPTVLSEEAAAAFAAGRLQQAESCYRQLATMEEHTTEALYWIGVIRRRVGDFAAAQQFLERAVRRDPDHANAWFQLGRIAEQHGDPKMAGPRYMHALGANPSHHGAQESMANLFESGAWDGLAAFAGPVGAANGAPPPPDPEGGASTSTPQPAPESKDTAGRGGGSAGPTAAEPYGIYQFLVEDKSPASRNVAALMDSVRLNSRARVTAYLGRHFGRLCVFPLVGGVLLFLIAAPTSREFHQYHHLHPHGQSPPSNLPAIAVGMMGFVVLSLLTIAAVTVYAKSIHFEIEHARLQVRRGVLRKRRSTVELWRVQNIELDRTLVNRLTGDGSLALHLNIRDLNPALTHRHRRGKGHTDEYEGIILTGIARGARLDSLYETLLNLAYTLRTNPHIKGIFQ